MDVEDVEGRALGRRVDLDRAFAVPVAGTAEQAPQGSEEVVGACAGFLLGDELDDLALGRQLLSGCRRGQH
jgi:hypothetical protein